MAATVFSYFSVVTFCVHWLNQYSFFISFQLQEKKTDRMKAAEASIKVLLDDPSKEMAELIKEAQAK